MWHDVHHLRFMVLRHTGTPTPTPPQLAGRMTKNQERTLDQFNNSSNRFNNKSAHAWHWGSSHMTPTWSGGLLDIWGAVLVSASMSHTSRGHGQGLRQCFLLHRQGQESQKMRVVSRGESRSYRFADGLPFCEGKTTFCSLVS